MRTLPVVASATRRVASLWSRELETNASCEASGLQYTSDQPSPPQTTWSQMVDRWASGGMSSRTRPEPSAFTMTRSIMKIALSPGSGYFQASSSGWPATVLTRYMSPVGRESCWKVAIFFESGDQSRMGRSLRVQPALLVA